MAKNSKASAKKSTKPRKDGATVEYHVVPDGHRWNVERADAFTGSFAYEVNTAIGLATAAAQRDQHNGIDATVCVQQPDGHCQHVWP